MTRRAVAIAAGFPIALVAVVLYNIALLFLPPMVDPTLVDGKAYCSISELRPVKPSVVGVVDLSAKEAPFRVGRSISDQSWLFGIAGKAPALNEETDKNNNVRSYYWFRATADQPARVLYDGDGPQREMREIFPPEPTHDRNTDVGALRKKPLWHPLHWLSPSFHREEQYLDIGGRSYHSDQSAGWGWPRFSPSKEFLYIVGGRGSAPGHDGGNGRTTVEIFRVRDQQRLVFVDIKRRGFTGGGAIHEMRWFSDTEFIVLTGPVSEKCLFCRLAR